MKRIGLILLGLAVGSLLFAACGDDEATADDPVVRIYAPYRGAEADLFMAGLGDWADTRASTFDTRAAPTSYRTWNIRYSRSCRRPTLPSFPNRDWLRSCSRRATSFRFPSLATEVIEENYDDAALDLGLVVPETMAQLETLVEEVEAIGLASWCLGIEAQQSTGWPATDWVEDLVVRQAGADVYRDWVSGVVPFSDRPEVFAVLARLATPEAGHAWAERGVT